MTEWAVVGVIVVLVGLFASLAKPLLSLNKSIVTLTVTMAELQKSFEKFGDENADSHRRLWAKNDAQDKRLDEHERRIIHIEDTNNMH